MPPYRTWTAFRTKDRHKFGANWWLWLRRLHTSRRCGSFGPWFLQGRDIDAQAASSCPGHPCHSLYALLREACDLVLRRLRTLCKVPLPKSQELAFGTAWPKSEQYERSVCCVLGERVFKWAVSQCGSTHGSLEEENTHLNHTHIAEYMNM